MDEEKLKTALPVTIEEKEEDEEPRRATNASSEAQVETIVAEKWYDMITVEPTMFLYMMAFMLTTVVEQVFFVYKACRVNHGYDEEICRNIEKYDEIKKAVQKTVSSFHQWDGIAGHIIPIVLALFLGSWSDRRGRKFPLLMGLIGKFIYSFMIVVNANMLTWPLEYVIYTATIPAAFTGADVAIFASAFAYICDVTTVKNRTTRITILDAFYLSTMPTGVALGKVLYEWVNHSFGWMFVFNASLLLLAILYSLFRLKWQTTSTQRPLSDVGYSRILCDFFNKDHVALTFRTVLKPRLHHRRAYLFLIFIAMAFYTFQRDERQMLYLYVQLKLNWTYDVYSWFRTYQSSAYVVMMLLGIPLMTKVFKWRDTAIIMMGSVSHAAGRVFFALATQTWQMYAGATIASLGPVTAPVIRSMASKLVPVSERGIVFAVLSVFDNAVPLFSATLYAQLYNATIHTHPESIFWLTMTTQIIVFILIFMIHLSTRGRNLVPPELEKDASLIVNGSVESAQSNEKQPTPALDQNQE